MDYIKTVKKLKIKLDKESLSLLEIIQLLNTKKSLDEIEKLHLYLIKEVNNINNNELSVRNEELCKTNINASKCLLESEDIKIGGKIYFLNDDSSINYIFGDIHSDSITLTAFLVHIDFINKIQQGENLRLLFLGDYVDRGKGAFKTLELLLILKYLFPQNVFLLRGNHDGGMLINEHEYKLCVGRNHNTTDEDYFVATLFNMLKEKNKKTKLLAEYLKFFNNLCHIALLKNGSETILCVHGGIARPTDDKFDHLNTISDLYNENIIDNLNGSVVHNMLWSDPAEDISLYRDTRRFFFYEKQFDCFLEKFKINKIIRGHQAFEEGYKEFFGGRLISIFSSGKFNEYNTESAYNDILPCILKLQNGTIEVIRL